VITALTPCIAGGALTAAETGKLEATDDGGESGVETTGACNALLPATGAMGAVGTAGAVSLTAGTLEVLGKGPLTGCS
jgi:hypothetical protein